MEQNVKEHFMATVKRMGNKVSSNTLFGLLSGADGFWDADTFVRIKEELKVEGRIKMGRGRGGIIMSKEESMDGVNTHIEKDFGFIDTKPGSIDGGGSSI